MFLLFFQNLSFSFFPFIFISWRLITLQYCSGFCHTLDSAGEGEGGMYRENSIETCILSRVTRSPAQVGCMRQVLGPGTLGRPREIGWRGRWEGGSGWGIHVYPRLIHVNV